MAGNLDKYKDESTALESPANSAVAVTTSDVADLAEPSRALFIGGAGNLSVEMYGTGTAVVFANVQAGSILPIRVTRVNATGTTATSIVSVY